jgi:hypothetical protein
MEWKQATLDVCLKSHPLKTNKGGPGINPEYPAFHFPNDCIVANGYGILMRGFSPWSMIRLLQLGADALHGLGRSHCMSDRGLV